MKRLIIGIVILTLIGGAVFALIGRGQAQAGTEAAASTPTSQPEMAANEALVVEAAVVPVQSAELRFAQAVSSGGVVAEVLVAEGDPVKQGDPLARLDTRPLELKVEQAKVQLQQAQASYDKLAAGATAEEIAAAEAQVAQAQAQLRQAQGSVTTSDLAAARAQLQSARATLAQLEAGPSTTDVRAARAALEQARTELAEVEAGPKTADLQAAEAALAQAQARLASAESGPKMADVQGAEAALAQAIAQRDAEASSLSGAKTRAESQMHQAADDVRLAQETYSSAFWDREQAQAGRNPRTGRAFDEEGLDPETQQRQYAEALRTVELQLSQAEARLDQAKLAHTQAQQAEASGIAGAQAQVDQAQANLDQVRTSVDAEAVAAAKAQVAQAQANLEKIRRIDPALLARARAQVAQAQANLDTLLRVEPSQLAAARAAVVQAQASLAKLQGVQRAGSVAAAGAGVEQAQANLAAITAPAGPPDLASALAEVAQARIVIKEAELALEQATLRAPIAGSIARINLQVGEALDPTIPALVMADFSTWEIETTDLTELSIVNIREGAPVTVTFDALPGVELPGTVRRIDPIGENNQGDITYTAIVTPDQQDARLRWNMTASVVFQPE